MRRAGRLAAVVVLAAAVAVAGCARDPAVRAPEPTSPFDPCPGPAVAPSEQPEPSHDLPPITLPCFTGGELVAVGGLGRPSVVNLWASWCEPCRVELPALQLFADAGRGKIAVLGVVTGDTRTSAAAAAEDFGITFPALFDPDRSLLTGVGRNALPVTLFLDASGDIRHIYQGGEPLTVSTLERLASQHLGVVVS